MVEEIEKLIEEGLIAGYKENLQFSHSFSDYQSRIIEYLIVVNIAQKLKCYCLTNDIGINLEYPLLSFYIESFPTTIMNEGNWFSLKSIEKKISDTEERDALSERIDIVLTSDNKHAEESISSIKPIIGIEIKSINQHKEKILLDVVRLSKGLSLTDKELENNLRAGFCCFFRRFESDATSISQTQITKRLSLEYIKWEKRLEEIESEYPNLEFSIKPILIANRSAESIKYETIEIDYDHSEILELSGCVYAYIIRITRKEQ